MFRKDKQQGTRPIKEVGEEDGLQIKEEKEIKPFEVKYNTITPYGRLGHWLQFIWRFK